MKDFTKYFLFCLKTKNKTKPGPLYFHTKFQSPEHGKQDPLQSTLLLWSQIYVCVFVCTCAPYSLQPCGLWPPQALLSMELSRQEYWSGLPFPTPGHLLNLGIELRSCFSCLGKFFTVSTTWEALESIIATTREQSLLWFCIFSFLCLKYLSLLHMLIQFSFKMISLPS